MASVNSATARRSDHQPFALCYTIPTDLESSRRNSMILSVDDHSQLRTRRFGQEGRAITRDHTELQDDSDA